ncbi:phosphoribosyltransferase-like protein [Laspinema palackyanum]|uniref:phosphoribosyltransferase-like protein n=1 Tax=Laspinema palackyanum TaxID=3231601 RepID=UPI003F53E5DE
MGNGEDSPFCLELIYPGDRYLRRIRHRREPLALCVQTEKYCLQASGSTDAGYRDSGALTCHHYSCPNNTLPFFHKPGDNWDSLFINSQTPTATRYKKH